MITKNFYKIVDSEIEKIIKKNPKDPIFLKYKKSLNNQKAYAFLIWFVEFYGKTTNYLPFITDGDKDRSCDIIFDKEFHGEKIFYVVQSKWNIDTNCLKEIDTKDVKYALNDFDTILRGKIDLKNVNKKLKKKLREFQTHIHNNGEVRFIILTLCNWNKEINDNINAFVSANRKTKIMPIDINKLKRDYIDYKYKEIKPENPLEYNSSPEEEDLDIPLVKSSKVAGNRIEINKPFESYVLLVSPKTIYDLFSKYGFSLFFKNVRNPLLESSFNKQIQDTIKDDPAYFWYYNNGITGITRVLPAIRNEAKKIKIKGLQIINGAQTVYSIYQAYKLANASEREVMDKEALVTLRLLKSGGKNFDLKVTRYTNSQNPVSDRDFYANEEIQNKIQNYFYESKFWYEKRDDEFRNRPESIKVVSNHWVANAYLAFILQDPTRIIRNFIFESEHSKQLIFTSHKDNPDGCYEKVFNDSTSCKEMLASFYLFDLMVQYLCEEDIRSTFQSNAYHSISLFKTVFNTYARKKYGSKVNIIEYIIKAFESGKIVEILAILTYINSKTYNHLKVNVKGSDHSEYVKFVTTEARFEQWKGKMEKMLITDKEFKKAEQNAHSYIEEYNKKQKENLKETKEGLIVQA